LFSTLLSR